MHFKSSLKQQIPQWNSVRKALDGLFKSQPFPGFEEYMAFSSVIVEHGQLQSLFRQDELSMAVVKTSANAFPSNKLSNDAASATNFSHAQFPQQVQAFFLGSMSGGTHAKELLYNENNN